MKCLVCPRHNVIQSLQIPLERYVETVAQVWVRCWLHQLCLRNIIWH